MASEGLDEATLALVVPAVCVSCSIVRLSVVVSGASFDSSPADVSCDLFVSSWADCSSDSSTSAEEIFGFCAAFWALPPRFWGAAVGIINATTPKVVRAIMAQRAATLNVLPLTVVPKTVCFRSFMVNPFRAEMLEFLVSLELVGIDSAL